MKIAIVGSRGYPYVYSGYETFVYELASRLKRKGHEVFVYCHKSLFKYKPSHVNGVNLFYIPAIEQKILSQFSHSFLSTIHVLFKKIDLVLYVNSANGPFGIFTKIFKKKTIINTDGLEWLRPKWKGLGSKYFYFSSWLSTKLFDIVVTDSDVMANIYREEFNSSSVTIAYGANIKYSTNPSLIMKFGLKPMNYYLVVGRLIPDNNADLIVSAFERFNTNKELVILGDVPYKDKYVEKVRSTKDERILFPGYVKDQEILKELYCNCYAYIHGHEFGGTNPSLLKALAYGCCVLALDTPFSREVLLDERHGIYYKKNIDSVLNTLNMIDSNPELVKEKKYFSRERILNNYTWEKIVDQYENIFYKLLNKDG